MKKYLLPVALSTVLCLIALRAGAQTPPLAVDVFAPRDGVMVGEPVVLTVRITNRSEGLATLGPPRSGRGEVEFQGATERRSPFARDTTTIGDDQYREIGRLGTRLKPRQSVSEKHVLDRWPGWLPFTQTGRYLLDVRLSFPFAVSSRDGKKSYTFSSVVGVPVYVTATDSKELRAKADTLRVRIAERKGKITNGQNDVEMDTLFSMPEEVAGPVWRRLIEELKPSLPASYDLRLHLRRIESELAIDLLAELWGEEGSSKRDLQARQDLLILYSFGSKEAKEHAGKIFVAREGKLPERMRIQTQTDGGH